MYPVVSNIQRNLKSNRTNQTGSKQKFFFPTNDVETVPIGSGVPRPEWQLRHVTLVKRVNTTAFIRTTHFRSFHKM